MLAEDLQMVLLFMSKSMKPFLTHVGRYLLVFFLTVLVLVPGFFISLKATGSVWGFVVLAAVVSAIHWLIRRQVVLPSLLRIDRQFFGFLQDDGVITGPLDPQLLAEALDYARKRAGSLSAFKVSRAIRVALLVLCLDSGIIEARDDERLNKSIGQAFKYSVKGYLFFGTFLVVFWGISFLSTLGLAIALKLLIFTLGTLFAAFLFQAILEPILYLLVLNRMHQSNREG
jgi:hypothetical protein